MEVKSRFGAWTGPLQGKTQMEFQGWSHYLVVQKDSPESLVRVQCCQREKKLRQARSLLLFSFICADEFRSESIYCIDSV